MRIVRCCLKSIIDRTVVNEKLESIHFSKKEEVKDESIKNPKSEDEKKKESLILALDNSASFANTHTIISEMEKCHDWSEEQASSLFRIALSNTQVNWILKDEDVSDFYTQLLVYLIDSIGSVVLSESAYGL